MHARSIVAGALMAATIALPAGVSARPRPRFEPTDLELALDSRDRFQLTGELGGSYFLTADPNQLHTTAGITWTVNDNLDLSVVGILGILPGDDRYGVLFGFEPKLRLFDAPPPRDKQDP